MSNKSGLISAFFSSVDDESELGYPGIHCTIGSLIKTAGIEDTFTIAASVVENFHRFCVDANYIFDLDKGYDPSVKFHPAVLKQINITPVSDFKPAFGTTRYYNYADTVGREETEDDFNSCFFNPSPYNFGSNSLIPVKPVSKSDREFDIYVDDQSDKLFTQLATLEQQGTIDGSITENVCIMFDDELNDINRSDYTLEQKKKLISDFCKEVLDLYVK